ncbi:hypothetical protein HY357_00450 [Candidatus Roizmanbacteria bacterium]|nr:hypothetical protein [Candidatus Roizmanbacteria bacterium]
MRLAQDPTLQQLFGTVAPPPGSPTDLGATIARLINLFLIVAGLAILIYMLWGGFDWVTSGGEKEKVEKARNKITNAVIGIFIVIIALTLFNVIAGNVLNIIQLTPEGWQFKLPLLNPPTPRPTCHPLDPYCIP